MNNKLQMKCARLLAINEILKTLDAEKKQIQAEISESMAGQNLLIEGCYEIRVKHTVRDTPQVKAIAEKFDIPNLDFANHPECFKRSEYDSIAVKALLVEG